MVQRDPRCRQQHPRLLKQRGCQNGPRCPSGQRTARWQARAGSPFRPSGREGLARTRKLARGGGRRGASPCPRGRRWLRPPGRRSSAWGPPAPPLTSGASSGAAQDTSGSLRPARLRKPRGRPRRSLPAAPPPKTAPRGRASMPGWQRWRRLPLLPRPHTARDSAAALSTPAGGASREAGQLRAELPAGSRPDRNAELGTTTGLSGLDHKTDPSGRQGRAVGRPARLKDDGGRR